MQGKQGTGTGFTLIEILVSITILSLILVSVVSIYISSVDINGKTDITRMLQQNIKSSIEMIGEDIKKHGYGSGVNMGPVSLDCEGVTTETETKEGTKLCIDGLKEYYLAEKNGATYTRVIDGNCEDINRKCTLVVNDGGIKPIMNSWVDVKNLRFLIAGQDLNKVTILMSLQPAIGKGIKPDIIKNNRFYFQTTLSERINLY